MTVDKGHGVWEEEVIERHYFGDVLSNSRRWSNEDRSTNANLTISNKLSIVADSFATDNIGAMRFVILGKTKWSIDSVEINWPRLDLTLGGVYNAPEH